MDNLSIAESILRRYPEGWAEYCKTKAQGAPDAAGNICSCYRKDGTPGPHHAALCRAFGLRAMSLPAYDQARRDADIRLLARADADACYERSSKAAPYMNAQRFSEGWNAALDAFIELNPGVKNDCN